MDLTERAVVADLVLWTLVVAILLLVLGGDQVRRWWVGR